MFYQSPRQGTGRTVGFGGTKQGGTVATVPGHPTSPQDKGQEGQWDGGLLSPMPSDPYPLSQDLKDSEESQDNLDNSQA